jgi:hypothetical protein
VFGLIDGSFCFASEESDTVWTTDKDGPLMDLLAAARTGKTGERRV